jgi:hypothetical protein
MRAKRITCAMRESGRMRWQDCGAAAEENDEIAAKVNDLGVVVNL